MLHLAHRWKVLTLVSAAVFLVSLDMFIVNLAFPRVEREFHGTTTATISWMLNAYTIVLAALMIPSGRLADRVGRRRVFLVGLVLFGLGSALCGASVSIEMVIASRVLQAVGAAALLPTSLALLLPEFAAEERARAIGIWAAVGAFAAAFGPSVGGLLVEASWRLVFYVNLPVAAVALVAARRLLAESREPSQGQPDLLGAALLSAAVGLVALALVEAPYWHWTSLRTFGALAGGILGLALLWTRCHRHPSPIVEPSLLRVPSYAFANLAAFGFSASFSAMLLAAVLFLVEVWHYSVLRAGVALAPGPLTAACVAALGGRFVNRASLRAIATTGLLLFAAGCAWWLWRVTVATGYAGEFLPGLLITGVGVGLTLPSLTTAAAASLPPPRFATGSAVFAMSRQLGFVLGVAALVALLGRSGLPTLTFVRHGWIFMIASTALAALAGLRLGPVSRLGPIEASRAALRAAAEPVAVEQPNG